MDPTMPENSSASPTDFPSLSYVTSQATQFPCKKKGEGGGGGTGNYIKNNDVIGKVGEVHYLDNFLSYEYHYR